MRLALGQMNATIGDFAGNGAKIEALWKEAEAAKADLLLVPEMALCGYPPRDLLDRPSFQAEVYWTERRRSPANTPAVRASRAWALWLMASRALA